MNISEQIVGEMVGDAAEIGEVRFMATGQHVSPFVRRIPKTTAISNI